MAFPLWYEILGWLLEFLIVLGNGLVIYLIISRPTLRTVTNWLILSLAVSDLGTAVYFMAVTIPSGCDYDKPCTQYYSAYAAYCVGNWFYYASALSLCALTCDRYLAIVQPFRYVTYMTKKRTAALISASWCIPAVIVFIPLLTLEFAMSPGKTHDNLEKYLWSLLVAINVLICISLLFTTARILFIARKHSRQNAAVVRQVSFNHVTDCKTPKPQESAATMLIGTLVLIFVICYSVHTADIFCFLKMCERTTILPAVASLLVMVNSAANPLVYAFFKREIKRELKKLCCCRNKMHNSEPECVPFRQKKNTQKVKLVSSSGLDKQPRGTLEEEV